MTTKSSINLSIFEFRFKQNDYGDVCTLINIINILDYIKDTDSVNILKPYLEEDKLDDFVDKHDKISDKPGYQLKAVM